MEVEQHYNVKIATPLAQLVLGVLMINAIHVNPVIICSNLLVFLPVMMVIMQTI